MKREAVSDGAPLAVAAIRFSARVSGQPEPTGAHTASALKAMRREAAGRGQARGIGWGHHPRFRPRRAGTAATGRPSCSTDLEIREVNGVRPAAAGGAWPGPASGLPALGQGGIC